MNETLYIIVFLVILNVFEYEAYKRVDEMKITAQ